MMETPEYCRTRTKLVLYDSLLSCRHTVCLSRLSSESCARTEDLFSMCRKYRRYHLQQRFHAARFISTTDDYELVYSQMAISTLPRTLRSHRRAGKPRQNYYVTFSTNATVCPLFLTACYMPPWLLTKLLRISGLIRFCSWRSGQTRYHH